MKNLLICAILILGSSVGLTGQDLYGYLNFGNLISIMPETQKADQDLEVFQQELVAKGEEMAKAFDQKVNDYYAAVKTGDITEKTRAETEAALQKDQQAIIAYEREVVQKVQAKRQELLKPIIEKATEAIKEIGRTKGYALIFDSSIPNAILFTEDANDVMPLVKALLGIE